MNARIQVEHPVTEDVTRPRPGAAASSRSRRAARSASTQADVRLRGHAVEARLYAEDAEHGFLPAAGRVLAAALAAPARACASTPASSRATWSGCATTRCSPSSSRTARRASERSRGSRAALDETVVLG